MSFTCHSHAICMSLVCTHISSVCHPHSLALVCYPYVTRMNSYVIRMSLVCTRMSCVCHSYVLVCHPYYTGMSLVRTRMSSVCHSYVLVCHPYATRMWFYHQPIIDVIICLLKGSKLRLSFCGISKNVWNLS